MKSLAIGLVVTALAFTPTETDRPKNDYKKDLERIDSLARLLTHVERKVDKRIVGKALDLKSTSDSLSVVVTEQKKEMAQLVANPKIVHDTVVIRDTIKVAEKKSFWGKTKIDTTKTN